MPVDAAPAPKTPPALTCAAFVTDGGGTGDEVGVVGECVTGFGVGGSCGACDGLFVGNLVGVFVVGARVGDADMLMGKTLGVKHPLNTNDVDEHPDGTGDDATNVPEPNACRVNTTVVDGAHVGEAVKLNVYVSLNDEDATFATEKYDDPHETCGVPAMPLMVKGISVPAVDRSARSDST